MRFSDGDWAGQLGAHESTSRIILMFNRAALAGLLTKALAKAQHTSLTLAVLGHSASAALLVFYADPATRGVRFV